jgi:protein-tyrosine phosphatase
MEWSQAHSGVARTLDAVNEGAADRPVREHCEVLVLCTANQCRSPMAEVLLRDRLAAAGVDAVVRSAGDLPGGVRVSPGSVKAMATRGLSLAQHVSQTITPAMVRTADLVVAMGRRHLRSAVALVPDAFGRTFTLKELVRRASAIGPRPAQEPFEAWLERVHAGRERAGLLGEDARDDVADPMGGPARLYEATAVELSQLVDDFVGLAFPSEANRETA